MCVCEFDFSVSVIDIFFSFSILNTFSWIRDYYVINEVRNLSTKFLKAIYDLNVRAVKFYNDTTCKDNIFIMIFSWFP